MKRETLREWLDTRARYFADLHRRDPSRIGRHDGARGAFAETLARLGDVDAVKAEMRVAVARLEHAAVAMTRDDSEDSSDVVRARACVEALIGRIEAVAPEAE